MPAAVLCRDFLARPRVRLAGIAVTFVVCGTTALYAAAYMNVFLSPDARLTAAASIATRVPNTARPRIPRSAAISR